VTSEQEISPEQLREMGRKQTEIKRGASRIVITIDDVRAIEASLGRAVEASQLEDRDYLLPVSGGWIDPDGTVRIGAWVLDPTSDPLTLTIRIPGLDSAPAIVTYHATLAHDASWHVVTIVPGHILRR